MFVILKMVRQIQNYFDTQGMLVTGPKDFFQARQRSLEFDFESEEEFTFCASPPFNTLSTKKLKDIVLEAKTTFKWQFVERGTTSQRRLLQRLDVFKA